MSAAKKIATVGGIVGASVAAKAVMTRKPPYSFQDKSVLITGGSRGLGLVMARLFAAEGARLSLAARDTAELERAASELRGTGARVLTITADVRKQADCQDIIKKVIAEYGQIDVLINNAGVIQAGPVEHMELSDFESALATHTMAPLYLSLEATPHMRNQGEGRIVNIASVGGLVSVPHLLPYSTSKFALVGLSGGLRSELAKYGIKVTTVCPGLMRTGSQMNAEFKGQHKAEFTWFSLIDAMPFASISAERAAKQIVEATRKGAPHLTISVQAKLLGALNGIAPGLMGSLLKLMNSTLPKPTDDLAGDEIKTGWESQTSISPSILTRLSDRATDNNNGLNGHEPLTE